MCAICVLYVPGTPLGKLAKLVQAQEDRFSELYKVPWVKVVERGGEAEGHTSN